MSYTPALHRPSEPQARSTNSGLTGVMTQAGLHLPYGLPRTELPSSKNHLLAHRQPLSLAILSIGSNLVTNTAYSVFMNCLNYLPLAPSWCHLETSPSNDFMFSFRSLIKVLYSSWTPTNPRRTTLEMQIISHLQLHPEISVSQF